MAAHADEFWDLLNRLGSCYQAQIDALKIAVPTPSPSQAELTVPGTPDTPRSLSLVSRTAEETSDRPKRSRSPSDAVSMRSLSRGSSVESVRVSEIEAPSIEGPSRVSSRISVHDGGTRSRINTKVMMSHSSYDADLSESWRGPLKEEDHALEVGHKLQEQLAHQTGSFSSNSQDMLSVQPKIVFQPWQAWCADPVHRRARRQQKRKRPENKTETSHETENLVSGDLQAKLGGSELVLSPLGPVRLLCDLLCFVFVTCELILLPLRVFDEVPAFKGFCCLLWMSQIFWNFRMLVTFNTGYYFRGHLVRNRRTIAKSYLKTWFVFDALNISVDWLLTLVDLSHNFEKRIALKDAGAAVLCLWIIQVLLRLCRLVALGRISLSAKKHMVSEAVSAHSIIAQSVFQILLMHHVLACAWYGLGANPLSNISWVTSFGVDSADLAYKYTTSLHWTFCQLGFGSSNIEASNLQERMFSLLVVFAALVVFSTLLAAITSMTTKLNRASESKQEQFRQLWKYMKQHQIEEDLQMRVAAFLEHAYTLRQAVVADSAVPILDLLSKPLQVELHNFRYLTCLRKLDVMKQLLQTVDQHSAQALRSLPQALSHQTFAPADHVFECGLLAKAAYFVADGEFAYELNGEKVSVENGRWVAEMSLWTPWLHLGDLTTRDVCGVVVLDVSAFADTLRRSSESLLKAQEYARDLAGCMNQEKIITDLWRCQVYPEAMPRLGSGDRPKLLRSMTVAGAKAGHRLFAWSWRRGPSQPEMAKIVPS